jgi:hypothetical protein
MPLVLPFSKEIYLIAPPLLAGRILCALLSEFISLQHLPGNAEWLKGALSVRRPAFLPFYGIRSSLCSLLKYSLQPQRSNN